jgi:LysM repeat protein
MAELPASDSGSAEANSKVPKKGLKTGKQKWYIVGGLAAVAILVFYFVSRSKSSAAASGTTATTGTTLDPATQAALQNALGSASQANNAVTQGDPGSAGPAGAVGATGKTGATGATGKSGTSSKTPAKAPPKSSSSAPKTQYYTVRPGDSLSKIAGQFHLPNWQALYNMNRTVVGNNPNLIHPGMRLKI